MSYTLAQARTLLSPYVENGNCSNQTIVRLKINEAQTRIHSGGDFLGLVKRWGVTVDPTTGEFDVPSNAESIMRFSELAPGLAHSTTGTVITDDAYAFVFDYPSMTKFRQVSPRRFKILGPYPTAVDVMGKVKMVEATLESDVLVVQDISALKLMVMSLYNEETNGPELSKNQSDSCFEYLNKKTSIAVDAARRTSYESILSAAAQGTRGYNRCKLALGLTGGLRQDDHMVCELVDQAESRVMANVQYWEEYLLKCSGGIFSTPPEIESILMADFNNCPTTLRGPHAEFITSGIGYREKVYGATPGISVIDRGESALHTDLTGPSKLRFYFYGTNAGVVVSIEGISTEGAYISERVSLSGGQLTETVNTYAQVNWISCDPRDGAISVLQDDNEVAYIWPYTQSSTVHRYAVPSNVNCTQNIIRIIGRARHIPKVRDEQRMQIQNDQVITLMGAAITLERSGDLEKSVALEAKSIRLYEQQMLNKNAGRQVQLNMPRSSAMRIRVGY